VTDLKSVWLVRRDERAVSPVISTILMVAITVVLAAVLYVMVSGLIGPTGSGNPTVAFSPAVSVNANTWRIDVGSVSSAVALSSYQIVVLDGTTVAIPATAVRAGTNIASGGGLVLNYTDTNSDAKLTGGDFFVLSGTLSGHNYQMQLIWLASGSRIVSANVPP
jgi:flagellin-like protein